MINEDSLNDFISSLAEDDLFNLWHEYCGRYNCYDDEIYVNDEEIWDIYYENKSPWEIVNDIYGTGFNPNDDYVYFGVYGPTTFNYVDSDKSPFDLDTILRLDTDGKIELLDEAGIDYSEVEEEDFDGEEE